VPEQETSIHGAILAGFREKAEEFGSIERQVNDFSRLRKIHAEEAIGLIRQSMEIGDILAHEFEIISRTNRTMRDRDTTLQNYCLGLELNIRHQKELLRLLTGGPHADPALLEKLEEMSDALASTIQKAIILLNIIVRNDTEIVLMDDLAIRRKKLQRESIDRLKKLAFRTAEDAEAAIRGSAANIRRSRQLIERLDDIQRLVEEHRTDQMAGLIEEAIAAWNVSAAVHRSSVTQTAFTGEANRCIGKLHADSIAIRDLVITKDRLISHNHELVSELTVILSLEIKEFLPAADMAEETLPDSGMPDNVSSTLSNLLSYMLIACRDIGVISGMNFDMHGAIELNADMEKKAVELTKMKTGYFSRIRDEVRSMTEAAQYPIMGSGLNIENGKTLELYLRQIAEQMRDGGADGADAP
jgi:hypothetical protein